MTQTETVTRQALEERVRPVLYINKIDRLVKELRLDPAAMQKWLSNIIAEFNRLVDLYAEPELKEKWKVSIQGNTVAFGSAKDRYGTRKRHDKCQPNLELFLLIMRLIRVTILSVLVSCHNTT